MYERDFIDYEPPKISYCPYCGENVDDRDSDGSCHCEACDKVFNVIDIR